ncbi:MAG: hypothetical protein LRY71_01265 [Bacillaceae bacterium]|nr:hypothetical protein [Bacillaceae bacterium]
MHVFVAIESFKGSMTSKEANEAVRQALPNVLVETFPFCGRRIGNR